MLRQMSLIFSKWNLISLMEETSDNSFESIKYLQNKFVSIFTENKSHLELDY